MSIKTSLLKLIGFRGPKCVYEDSEGLALTKAGAGRSVNQVVSQSMGREGIVLAGHAVWGDNRGVFDPYRGEVSITSLVSKIAAVILLTPAFVLFPPFTEGTARGEASLPMTTQDRLLNALAPLGPGATVEGRWSIGNIAIESDHIDIELSDGSTRTHLLFVHRATVSDATRSTESFAVQLAQDAPVDRSFARTVDRIVAGISKDDDGTYFQQTEQPFEEKRPGGDNDVGIQWVLAFLLVLGSLLVLNRPRRETFRTDLPVALALMAVAFALRVGLGPLTFLHENAHGVHLLEQIAHLSFIERPMAGQTALGHLIAWVHEPSVAAIAGGVALISSGQAGLAYLIGRSLRVRPAAAGLAGLLVATLPILTRMTSSEDAFGPATTFLMVGALFAVQASRRDSTRVLAGALVFVSIAGHFRPVMYTVALPMLFSVVILSSPGERLRWLRRPGFYVAGCLFALTTLDDVGGILARMGEGSPMTAGWWRGNSLHSWPLVDSVSTPVWFLPLTAIGGAIAVRTGRGREILWLAVLGLWLTFVYTSDNAWPASLRYAVAYAWLCPLAIALGLDGVLSTTSRKQARAAFIGVCILALSAPLTHAGFISFRFVQQEELDFQTDEVIPHLLSVKGAVVVTPWPELDHMSGTLNTTPLRLNGVDVVHHTEIEKIRFSPSVFWYRGLACWAKRDSDTDIDVSKMNKACRDIESGSAWKPVTMKRLNPVSDADWIQIGDGSSSVEVGLLVRTGGVDATGM